MEMLPGPYGVEDLAPGFGDSAMGFSGETSRTGAG